MTPSETAVLHDVRGYASANRIIISRHAYRRMEERGATEEDVFHALVNAEGCSAAEEGKWKIKSRDIDGDMLYLIVAIRDGVIVITLFG